MANNRALDNQLREKVLAEVMDFFRKNEEDVLQTNSNECVFPCLDSEGNEKWIQIVRSCGKLSVEIKGKRRKKESK